MESTWILFSILTLTAVWLWDFVKKLVLSKGWDKDVFLSVCLVLFFIAFWTNNFFQGTGVFSQTTIQSAFIIGSFHAMVPLWILASFKYLNVSFALVTLRIVTSFLVLFIWVFLLWDQLSLYNMFWFFLWAVAIFLLSGFRIGDMKNTMPRKWVIALCATIVWVTVSNSYYKYIVEGLPIHDYTAVQFTVIGLWTLLYMILRNKITLINIQEVKKVWWYAVVNVGIFVIVALYLLPNMYLAWPLSLSYKMMSYSLAVPILLSVIFLWEEINRTRIIAFGLTIVSIFLFLI